MILGPEGQFRQHLDIVAEVQKFVSIGPHLSIEWIGKCSNNSTRCSRIFNGFSTVNTKNLHKGAKREEGFMREETAQRIQGIVILGG